MIHKTDCYLLTCDNCQEHFEDCNSCFYLFVDSSTAIDEAQSDDWHISDDNKHYCYKCYKIDDDDQLIINTERAKIE